ncbi:hypothetical protein WJX77_002853 [Trebouxia sp. C0004]
MAKHTRLRKTARRYVTDIYVAVAGIPNALCLCEAPPDSNLSYGLWAAKAIYLGRHSRATVASILTLDKFFLRQRDYHRWASWPYLV